MGSEAPQELPPNVPPPPVGPPPSSEEVSQLVEDLPRRIGELKGGEELSSRLSGMFSEAREHLASDDENEGFDLADLVYVEDALHALETNGGSMDGLIQAIEGLQENIRQHRRGKHGPASDDIESE